MPDPKPTDDAVRLATIARNYQGRTTELRVEWASFNGSPRFLKLQLWETGSDGALHPTRKCLTVRARELAQVATAIAEARKLADAEAGPAQPDDERPGWFKRFEAQRERRER